MSLTRPARCLFCSFSRAASAAPRVPRRQFHATPLQLNNRKPKAPTPETKALDAKTSQVKSLEQIYRDMKPEDFKPYTEEEKAVLREHYSPEQIAAIEAGEAAIDPKDLASQFHFRRDPMHLKYLDDLSVIEPVVDHHVRAPESNSDYNATLKSEEDFLDDFAQYFEEMPEKPDAAHWVRFLETTRLTHGKEENELNAHSALVPDVFEHGESLDTIGQPPPPRVVVMNRMGELEDQQPEAISDMDVRLHKVTGYSKQYLMSLYSKNLVTKRVVNQTRMGKIASVFCLTIVGNRDGMLGLGTGKSEEVADAMVQARARAITNMQYVPRYEGRTIFGDVEGKVGATELKLYQRPPGFGLRCQHMIFEMCRAAGIQDIAARISRARNPMNTAKAAYAALMSQRNPEDIARARGKKIVDVRGVYYSGKFVRKPSRVSESKA
ncbi:37S ribosomal protein S5 [Aspergillus heteromorphus CBS 117.55]|uniref:Small ribosomal subunit protein uS5m n=1 Tax=Aspergillus heteromorphus CBS 117.55 TaxID=1448321 RepID=A0A317WIK7_9EURO|nr:37S ribosomal protein S5 [Aspergillus heteromorphus CBS 117.55]PWY84898.1 37S ribosomal protein S5 [Aspergillus heteromorphus CBS 117.55]